MANQKAKHGSAAGDPQDAQARPDDQYDEDLAQHNQRDSAAGTMAELANQGDRARLAEGPLDATGSGTDQGEFPQHARRGQAQSPVEATPNQPGRSREGHPGGARDS